MMDSQYYKDYAKRTREHKKKSNPSLLSAKTRNANLKRNYGICSADYEEQLNAQNGVCAICKKPNVNGLLVVDHDHSTGMLRGLLCNACNVGLFWLEGDRHVDSALEYLKKYNPKEISQLEIRKSENKNNPNFKMKRNKKFSMKSNENNKLNMELRDGDEYCETINQLELFATRE